MNFFLFTYVYINCFLFLSDNLLLCFFMCFAWFIKNVVSTRVFLFFFFVCPFFFFFNVSEKKTKQFYYHKFIIQNVYMMDRT